MKANFQECSFESSDRQVSASHSLQDSKQDEAGPGVKSWLNIKDQALSVAQRRQSDLDVNDISPQRFRRALLKAKR